MCRLPKETDARRLLTTDDRRPGILVLINDADWELEGEEKYELQQGEIGRAHV